MYLGDAHLLEKSDKNGDYIVVIDKGEKAKGLTFKKAGYKTSTFPLKEQKDVYTFMYLLDKQ